MPINDLARRYLETFALGGEFPDGLAFRPELVDTMLDYSRESLARIDDLLDGIRAREQPEYGAFMDDYANQTFMYLLAFYVGTVTARQSGSAIDWLDYGEMIEVIPDNESLVPQCFASSVTCVIHGKGFFVPLASIEERLFEDVPEKSVAFSAATFI
jgi:hypothetical protein